MPKQTTRRLVGLEASADVDSIREETYNGKTYTVVPVVALVEGVIQGMNAEYPEFAPASAFGKFPAGWNGRPLVMNHPTDSDGTPISANSAPVLEKGSMGLIFNTELDGSKLKTEAWIDQEEVAAKGGEFQTTLDRVLAGEMIEVSTGCFVVTEEKEGKFGGEKYKAVWLEVVPDHLAFLSDGVKGACSNADGCGAPRINTQAQITTAKKPEPKDHADCGCEDHNNCQCDRVIAAFADFELPEQANLFMTLATARAKLIRPALKTQQLPTKLLSGDIEKALCTAIKAMYSRPGQYGSAYIIGFTSSVAVYEYYDYSDSNYGYKCYQIAFSMDNDGVVTFTGEPQEVVLLRRIVTVNQQENTMADDKTKKEDPKANASDTDETKKKVEEPTADDKKKVEEPTNNESKKKDDDEDDVSAQNYKKMTPKKPKTMQEYIDEAPAELQEVLSEGVRLQAEKKSGLIKALTESKKCDFSESELKAMSTQQLEKMAKLAQVDDYSGRATPRTNSLHAQGDDDKGYTPAPRVFEAYDPTKQPDRSERKH